MLHLVDVRDGFSIEVRDLALSSLDRSILLPLIATVVTIGCPSLRASLLNAPANFIMLVIDPPVIFVVS